MVTFITQNKKFIVDFLVIWVHCVRGDLEDKNKEIDDLKEEKSQIQANSEKLDHLLTEQRSMTDGLSKQLESSNNAVSDLQKQLESQGVTMQQLEQDVTQKASEVTAKEEEIVKARLDITRSVREVEDLKKKMVAAEKAKEELVADRTRLKADIVALKSQITDHKHQALVDKKKMDETKQSVTSLEVRGPMAHVQFTKW